MTAAETATTGRAARLGALARARFRTSCDVTQDFFVTHQDEIVRACEQMANRFRQGGRLFVFGTGASVSDAQHVSVEFVHPVIVGKRALPALALGSTERSHDGDDRFDRELQSLADPRDIALGLSAGTPDVATRRGLTAARERGMLTVAIGGSGTTASAADIVFAVPAPDPFVTQEVQETLYHVLWELVHVFLDHGRSDG